jgi:hypothetical protein
MALMRTGRKMMMGDPPDKTRDVGPMKVLSAAQSARNLMPVKISGSKDDIYGTYANRGDIEDAKYKNRVATETYNKASSEYKQKSEAKSSYDKQKSAYDDYVKSKPTRKAKGTIDDMTEQQYKQAMSIGTITGKEREDYLRANPDVSKRVLPNQNINVYGYTEGETGKFDPVYESRKYTDAQIASGNIKGDIGKTKRLIQFESSYNDPGADPGDPGQSPKSPGLVKPKTTTLKKPKIEEAESWNAPTRTRGGGSVFKGEKVTKKPNEKRQKGYTYGKEKKMAAAYYGIGGALGEDDRYATSGELGDFQKTRKEEIKDMKSVRRGSSSVSVKKNITEDIKSSRKDIREAKLGKKYVESLPNRYQSIAGVDKNDIRRNTANEKVIVGANKPKRVIRDFTPEAMKGSTEQERQAMLTEKKKVKNLGRKETIRPRNR